MKRLSLAALSVALSLTACAQDANPAAVAAKPGAQSTRPAAGLEPAVAPGSPEARARDTIRKLAPNVRIDQIGAAPVKGFREAIVDGQVFYISDDGKYVMQGALYDVATRENLKRLMAIILFEKGKGEAISVATIQGEFGSRFQITGSFSPAETNNLALLIRAGALAAPMEIIEERTIGPSLGRDNIEKGFRATMWGFILIVSFMSIYYVVFGVISSIALGVNLLLLVALLSLLQATLTLPGIAAIALTLGMAIDANVLINERIREELRGGATPQAAIAAGYERAWGTILDSNVTTLIAGLALLIFGQGPVRGFAVVHCLGILTSMFSAVTVSRAMVNLVYGHRRRVAKLAIGNTAWK